MKTIEIKNYLRDKNATNKSIIFHVIYFDNKRIKISSGISVLPKNWNNEKQIIKSSHEGAFEFNDQLKKKKRKIEDIYHKAVLNEENFTKLYLEDKLKNLEEVLSGTSSKDFTEYYKDWIKSAKNTKTAGTIRSYTTTLNHFTEFSEKHKFNITFKTIGKDFYERFTNFLFYEKDNYNSNVGRHIKNIVTFLNEMTENGKNTNLEYNKKYFKVFKDEPEIFALSTSELTQLINVELSPRLDRVRDLFLFEANTGLRFSDVQNLKHNNIESDHIVVPVIKTKENLKLPLNNAAKSILTKYYNQENAQVILPKITNQKMNLSLKEIGFLLSKKDIENKVILGWNEAINIIRFKGVKRFESQHMKYSLLTTHTARRSFVTNALELGIPSTIVMQLVGHKKLDTMKRYTKHNEKSLADAINKFNV
ncbi:MAG: site-specific integrase [bacterium]|nr:site-specific integrase [bacterium]